MALILEKKQIENSRNKCIKYLKAQSKSEQTIRYN